jgi:D-beta-D-heptose 7-phosphate kinase/D-beta-D-heptose 1-phosphate adenosyltransferase
MLDINKHSQVTRNAPEADIPIYNILDINYILGGASNVAQNLKNLDTNVEIISVIGEDVEGNIIKNILKSKNINHNLFVDKKRKTTQKNRIFLNNKLNVRFDIESKDDISTAIEKEIFDYIIKKENINAIILSDYDKGVLTESLSQNIINFANQKNIPTFVDPKIKNYIKYKDCFLFKPNQLEAEYISGNKNIDKMLEIIKERINCKNILLTRGKEGMILNNLFNNIQHNSTISLVDVTGAGDIVLAVIVYSYLKFNDLLYASKIANYIGGKSVGTIGNYNVSINDFYEFDEIEKNLEKNKIIFDFEIEKLQKLSNMNNIVFTNGCFDILHSAHVELLKFSKKQGDILVVGLNSDESIKRLKGLNRPINYINERSKLLSLLDFIDYIVIFDDDTPLNIIKILKPDILIKGSDYKKEDIVGKEFVNNIILFNFIQNKSSTNIINKIKNLK